MSCAMSFPALALRLPTSTARLIPSQKLSASRPSNLIEHGRTPSAVRMLPRRGTSFPLRGGARFLPQASKSPAVSGEDPSADGGKSAEVSTEGEGKALTVSYSTSGSNLDAAAEDLEEAGDKLQDAGERLVDSISEVGDVIQDEVEDTLDVVVAEVDSTSAAVREDVEDALDSTREAAEEVASDLADATEDVTGVNVKQQAAELQSSVQVARRETQKQAELAGRRADSAYSRIEAQGQRTAQVVQKAGDRVAAALGSSNLPSVLPTAIEETVGAVSDLQQVISEATEDLVTQTLASITGADSQGRSGLSSITAPVADPTAPEPGEEEEVGGARPVPDAGPYKGLNVFVAGAGGRTGRLLVENLAKKGVPVRALVRNSRKEKYLGGILGVQEYEGVVNLVAAAKNSGKVKKIVFVTSLGVSLLLFPLNIFYGLLFWKKQSELAVQRSGLEYTIVRPGGLKKSDNGRQNIVMKGEDTLFGGAITRFQVAEVCVEALIVPAASNKIVEVIAEESAPKKTISDLFESI